MLHVDHAIIETGGFDDPRNAARCKLLEPGSERGPSLTHCSSYAVLFHVSPSIQIDRQVTGNSRPVSEDCLIVSRKRCRSTAVSNVGSRCCFRPVRIASANRLYICPTLN